MFRIRNTSWLCCIVMAPKFVYTQQLIQYSLEVRSFIYWSLASNHRQRIPWATFLKHINSLNRLLVFIRRPDLFAKISSYSGSFRRWDAVITTIWICTARIHQRRGGSSKDHTSCTPLTTVNTRIVSKAKNHLMS
jgi:hypothetical protein